MLIPLSKVKLKNGLLHLLFWAVVWLFFYYYFGFNSKNEAYVLWFTNILLPITVANTYFSIYYLIPRYLIPKKYGQFILYASYVLVGSAYLLAIIMFLGYIFMSELSFKKIPPLSSSLPLILISMYLVVILVSAFSLLKTNYLSLEKNKTLENDFLQAQLQLKMEELKFLRMQIHPHFLFNTLNTLYGLALKKADETPEMVLKLSNLLDYILYQVNQPSVLLQDEVNHLKDYIELERARFNDSLQVNWDIRIRNEGFNIAPMLLIPFVENSFKHGDLIDGCLTIDISLKAEENELLFKISNSVLHNHQREKGIGLENIRKRLEILYPAQYQLSIDENKQEFIVQLTLNIHE